MNDDHVYHCILSLLGKPCLIPLKLRRNSRSGKIDRRYKSILTEVIPYDAEHDPDKPEVGLSHGFIHFRLPDGSRRFCGVNWFYQNVQAC